MKVGIIGMGMVGSAYKEALETKGFNVNCYDKYKKPYNDLNNIVGCDILFLCLPTVPKDNGELNIEPITDTIDFLKSINFKGLIILKSTVLPGTTKRLRKKYDLNIVHSPEYLAEATAFYNVIKPDRIVLGVPDDKVITDNFYRLHYIFHTPIYKVDSNTSEFAKFMENTFFATKVVFANEMNEIAKLYGAEYDKAKEILYMESRIGKDHLGINEKKKYGGHCLPKDTNQLIKDLEVNHNVKPLLLLKVKEVNDRDIKLENVKK